MASEKDREKLAETMKRPSFPWPKDDPDDKAELPPPPTPYWRFYGHYLPPPKHTECPFCERKFAGVSNLDIHLKKFHDVEKRQKCGYCGKLYQRRAELANHVNYKHLRLKPHECRNCGKLFMNKAVFNFHSLKCEDKENVPKNSPKKLPAKNPKEIPVKKVEKMATKTVHSPRLTRQRFPCQKCDMKFGTEHSLFQHQKGRLGNCFPSVQKSRKISVKSPKNSVKSPKNDSQKCSALKNSEKKSVKSPKIELKRSPSISEKNSVKSPKINSQKCSALKKSEIKSVKSPKSELKRSPSISEENSVKSPIIISLKKSEKSSVKSPNTEFKSPLSITEKSSVKSRKNDSLEKCKNNSVKSHETESLSLKKRPRNSIKPTKINLKCAKKSVNSEISVKEDDEPVSPKFVPNMRFHFNLAKNSPKLEAPKVCKFTILGKVSS